MQVLWRVPQRSMHRALPPVRPSIAVFQSAHHAVLAELTPGDSFCAAPGLHGKITTIGPVGPGLLVRPQAGDIDLFGETIQHLGGISAALEQAHAQPPQGSTKIGEAFREEDAVRTVALRSRPPLGFVDE